MTPQQTLTAVINRAIKRGEPVFIEQPPVALVFERIIKSALFRLDAPQIDLCESLIELCDAIKREGETNWSLGESDACTLDALLIGAYWSLAEWHGGQWSPEYAALCAIGSIFSPGISCPPTSEDEPEFYPYQACNEYFAARA